MKQSIFTKVETQLLLAIIVGSIITGVLLALKLADIPISFLSGLVGFTLVFVVLRDIFMKASLNELEAKLAGFADFENDISRRLASKQNLESEAHVASAQSQQEQLANILAAMGSRLDGLEQKHGSNLQTTPALEVPSQQAESIREGYSSTGILAKPAALRKIDLNQALLDDALTIHLQPVVSLEDRRPVNYEGLMRLKMKSGEFLDAGQFWKIAEKGNLLPLLDRKIIRTSVRMLETLKELKKEAGLFNNISAQLLDDAAAFRDILKFLSSNKQLADHLVFEISQRDYRHLKPTAKDRLGHLVDLGFKLSLDKVLDLRLDIVDLHHQGFRFVKIPAGILLHASVDEKAPALPTELANALREGGITLIASEVERENDALALIDFNVEFAQGMVFAPPRPIKAELMSAQA